MECFLLVDFVVVVEGAQDNLIVFCKLPDLVIGPELVAFFKRIGYTGKENKDFHTNVIFEDGLI